MSSTIKHRPTSQGREALPLPVGEVIYDSLSTEFVDLGGIFGGLASDRFSGYVRLLSPTAWGVVLFADGQPLAALYDDGSQTRQGAEGASAFGQEVASGQGAIDIAELPAELVRSVVALAAGDTLYSDLSCQWTELPELLQWLADASFTGGVTVRSEGASGFALLSSGELVFCYTSGMREASSDASVVLEMGDDPEATVEVRRTSGAQLQVIDLAEAVSHAGGRPLPALPAPGPAYLPEAAPAVKPVPAPLEVEATMPMPAVPVPSEPLAPAAETAPTPAEATMPMPAVPVPGELPTGEPVLPHPQFHFGDRVPETPGEFVDPGEAEPEAFRPPRATEPPVQTAWDASVAPAAETPATPTWETPAAAPAFEDPAPAQPSTPAWDAPAQPAPVQPWETPAAPAAPSWENPAPAAAPAAPSWETPAAPATPTWQLPAADPASGMEPTEPLPHSPATPAWEHPAEPAPNADRPAWLPDPAAQPAAPANPDVAATVHLPAPPSGWAQQVNAASQPHIPATAQLPHAGGDEQDNTPDWAKPKQ